MSKKKILSEATVRHFMKIANLGSLSGEFINEAFAEDEVVQEMGDHAAYDRDEEEAEALEAPEEEAEMGEEEPEEGAEEAPEEGAEEEGEVDLTPDEAEVLRSILQKLESAMGEEEAEEAEEAPEEELEAEMGMEEEPEPEAEMGMEEPEAEEEPIMEVDWETPDPTKCGDMEKWVPGKGCVSTMPGRKKKNESIEETIDRIAARVAKRILDAQSK